MIKIIKKGDKMNNDLDKKIVIRHKQNENIEEYNDGIIKNMDKTIDVDLREYKEFRYIVISNNNWGYGYILIDKKIFDDLKLKWNDNHTSYTDGCISWIQDRELGDKDFPGQKENEIYFGINTHRGNKFVKNIIIAWIDWIYNK